MRQGGCLCGAVRYKVEGPLSDVVACHCSQCRRQTGSVSHACAARARDVVIVGGPKWYHSSDQARRGFCPTCGSYLFWAEGAWLWVTAGTLDAPSGVTMRHHIHVASKGDYYEIRDGLPQWPQLCPEEER